MCDGVRNIVHLNAVSRSHEGLLLSYGRVLSTKTYKKKKMQSVVGRIAKSIGIKRRSSSMLHESIASIPASKLEVSSSAIVLLREDMSTEIIKRINDISVPNHNFIQAENSLVYNDTNDDNDDKVVITALDGSCPDCTIQISGQPGFLRGLAKLDKNTFFVGSQKPAVVYQVDLNAGRIVSTLLLDGETNESVYGVCFIPTEFKNPPK